MDTDIKWIRAREYAEQNGVNREWIVRLCQAGRIEGAYMAGKVWLMPADAEMPTGGRSGPKVVRDEEREVTAALARLRRRDEAERESRRSAQRLAIKGGQHGLGKAEGVLAMNWANGCRYDAEGRFSTPGGENLAEHNQCAHWLELRGFWSRLEEGTALQGSSQEIGIDR